MAKARTRQAGPLIVVLVFAAAFVAYWSFTSPQLNAAAAVLLIGLLIAFAANLAAPIAWAPAWTSRRIEGAAISFAGAFALALAEGARVSRTDLPFMDPEQLPPALWLVSAVCLLAGMWRLLDIGMGPVCARCGAPASSARCSRCGNELSIA